MAFSTGLIVANIYYCQPLIIMISEEFGVTESKAGVITFLTQAGYALGLLFLVPLGDKLERKKHILITTALAVTALIGAAISPNLLILNLMGLLIGFACIVPQLILPMAANLTAPQRRGKVLGIIMSGLLIGIILSRTFSGLVGAWLGWRSMFGIAAGFTLLLWFLMAYHFPTDRPHFKGSYAALMGSLIHFIKTQPVLREASAISALAFGTFGAFWTTMVILLAEPPFHFESDLIGLFGLAGAAGAAAAPLIGGSSDKRNPRIAIGLGIGCILLSYIIFYIFNASIIGIITGIIFLDLGLQGIHVSNQSRIYALIPEARNRLNTVYMSISFTGTALGSALGLLAWDMYKWSGVCAVSSALILMAGIVYVYTTKNKVTLAKEASHVH